MHACAAHAGNMSCAPAAGPRREFGRICESTCRSAWRDAALAERCIFKEGACAACPARCVAEHASCASLAACWQGWPLPWHTLPPPPCAGFGGHWRKPAFPGGAAACACRRNVGFFILPFPNEPRQCQQGGGTGGADKLLVSWEGEGCSRDCGSALARALRLMLPLLFLLEKRQDNGRVYYVNHNTRTTQWEDPRTQG